MITIKQKGDFKHLNDFLKKSVKKTKIENIAMVADRCIQRLKEATPKNSGVTANSWKYSITNKKEGQVLEFRNTNVQNGVKIALIIDVGHATGTGGWIEGKNFIEPIVREAYNEILNKAWKEIKNL